MKLIQKQRSYARFCFSNVIFLNHTGIHPLLLLTCLILFSLILISFNGCKAPEPTEVRPNIEPTGILKGIVSDAQGPISGSVVRIQTTDNYTTTNDSGQFTLSGLIPGDPVTITAWAPGYYNGGGNAYLPGSQNIVLKLIAYHTEDNSDYKWISAFSSGGDPSNCQNCHAEPNNPESFLPFDEWQKDAHAHTTENIRFLTMYRGTDIYGNQSPETQYGYNRDYGEFPLPPNPNLAYYGPGYKLDFPSTNGNCAACHAPAAAMNQPYGINPTEVTGAGAEGITCDFCHKVWDVRLNPSTGLPYDNMPGVLSFKMRRPPEEHQFFAGPLDDVAPGEDTYTPIQKQSQYCATCHYAKFWGIEIYNSFGEWLESPYSNAESGQTCQNCHMPTGLTDHFARLDKGGKQRNPKTLSSHRMLGAMDKNLLQNAVTLTANASQQENTVVVNVEIVNDRTGHHVPTDSPLRHMILLVQAFNVQGDTLTQITGPSLPDWCGIGDPKYGYYAGLPGKAYAKILEEM